MNHPARPLRNVANALFNNHSARGRGSRRGMLCVLGGLCLGRTVLDGSCPQCCGRHLQTPSSAGVSATLLPHACFPRTYTRMMVRRYLLYSLRPVIDLLSRGRLLMSVSVFLSFSQESRRLQTVVMQGADGKREKKKKTDVLEMDGCDAPLSLLHTTHCTPRGKFPPYSR